MVFYFKMFMYSQKVQFGLNLQPNLIKVHFGPCTFNKGTKTDDPYSFTRVILVLVLLKRDHFGPLIFILTHFFSKNCHYLKF